MYKLGVLVEAGAHELVVLLQTGQQVFGQLRDRAHFFYYTRHRVVCEGNR